MKTVKFLISRHYTQTSSGDFKTFINSSQKKKIPIKTFEVSTIITSHHALVSDTLSFVIAFGINNKYLIVNLHKSRMPTLK